MTQDCGCIARIDAQLVEKNVQLDTLLNMTTGKAQLAIALTKINKRGAKGPGFMVVYFCPFCGVKQ